MAEQRFALIIANSDYADPELHKLVAPSSDAKDLARVLGDAAIGGFDVRVLLNEPSYKLSEEIEGFFDGRKHDDLLLLYFTGHGIKDADGQLYFAASDTRLVDHNVRRSTAVAARFVNDVMSHSRSRMQVLLLDCCYSGAFAEGMLAKGGASVNTGDHLNGRGRLILTASDALQYSFEGEQVAGTGVRSIFTRTLVDGLTSGQADLDRDGMFSLDDVYEYLHTRISEERPEQKPVKMGFVEGEIFIGKNPKPLTAELAVELRESIEDRRPWVRRASVGELERLMHGTHAGLALAARQALTRLSADDSRDVSREAERALGLNSADPAKAVPPPPDRTVQSAATVRSAAATSVSAADTAATTNDSISMPWPLRLSIVPYVAVGMVVLVIVSSIILRNRNTSTTEPAREAAAPANVSPPRAEPRRAATAAPEPIVLPAPPFEYSYAGEADPVATNVRLVEVSESANKITDDAKWFRENGLNLPKLEVPNPARNQLGNVPEAIPRTYRENILVEAIEDGDYLLCEYGPDYSGGRYLAGFNPASGRTDFVFDFGSYIMPPRFVEEDEDYIEERITWATLEGGTLYVSNGHRTYAKSSYGLNAYITALEKDSGKLIWRSKPLVSNSSNFAIYKDAILTGYGFTAEPDYLYVLSKSNGRVVQTVKLKSGPDYIVVRGDQVFVRTYNANYVFRITE